MGKTSDLDPQKLGLLKALIKWRAKKAAELGFVKPTYFYMNKTLEKIAVAAPKTPEELLKAYGVPNRKLDDFEFELLELIKDYEALSFPVSKKAKSSSLPIKETDLEFYKLLVEMAWADGVLTDDEIEKLKIARERFNIPKELHDQIETGIKNKILVKKAEEVSNNKKILILAITEFFDKQERETRYCIAGIDIGTNKWIRPMNSSYTVDADDSKRFLKACDIECKNEIIRMRDLIEFELISYVPTPPHVEDYLLGSSPPEKIESFSSESLRGVFEKNVSDIGSVEDLGEYLESNNTSLILIKPNDFSHYKKSPPSPHKDYDLFVKIRGLNYDMKIKDIEFLSFYQENSPESVENFLKNNDVYLAVGLTRKFRDKHWPIIIGVHGIPKKSEVAGNDKVEFKLSSSSKKWNRDNPYHERIREIRKKSQRAYEKWSRGEDQKLKELFESGKSISQIANVLERRNSAIRARLKKLELIKR